MQIKFYIATLLLAAAANGLMAAPVLLGSHKLVKGLKLEILQPNTRTQTPESVTNMFKKLVTECSSDVYVLVDLPGLDSSDLTVSKEANWPNLVKYLHMSSSVVGLPWVEGPLDLAFLEKYIVRTCKAELVVVHEHEEELQQYRDIRKRVIKMDLKEIPANQPGRDHAIRAADDLMRKILRKIPSPHYTILLTLSKQSTVHPVPEFAMEEMPDHFEIFNDIVNEPRREQEVERNNYLYQNVEPYWNENKDPSVAHAERMKNDEIHLFDYELWEQNEKLVMAVGFMAVLLFVVKVLVRPLVRIARVLRLRK